MASTRIAILIAALALVDAGAQARLDARYIVTLAGVTIGKGAWLIDIGEDQYSAAASGATTGLLRVFASGEGTTAVRGAVVGGRFAPANYAASLTQDKDSDELRIAFAGGNVKNFSIVPPPPPPSPQRIPVTEVHLRAVTDPMTASLVRIPGNGDPVNPAACHRSAAIFDGRIRYELTLAYKRMERVKLDRSYEGPVVVCAIYFKPIAGYFPSAWPSSIWPPSATWKCGWRRSPAPAFWWRIGSAFRHRSVRALCRRRSSTQPRSSG